VCEYQDRCGETSNGETIERTLQTNPDLIILDVYVPKVDGFSAAKQIKKDFAHRAHNYALDAGQS
jgi:CheY-like chemotaxis protein